MVRAGVCLFEATAPNHTWLTSSRNKKLRDNITAAMTGESARRTQEQLRERTILRAALEELALSDYGGLTMEGVAARAGVNKTTVYRKWETKTELIRAALSSAFEVFCIGPTEGDLRTDLLRIAHKVLDFTRSSLGQSLMRLHLLQHPQPELAEIAKDLNAKQLAELGGLVKGAVARGELSPDADIVLLLEMLWGALHARVVMKNEPVDDALLHRIVDILMRAAGPPPQPGKARPKKAAKPSKMRPRASKRKQARR
jgi:AcrR family transcriptional regulator